MPRNQSTVWLKFRSLLLFIIKIINHNTLTLCHIFQIFVFEIFLVIFYSSFRFRSLCSSIFIFQKMGNLYDTVNSFVYMDRFSPQRNAKFTNFLTEFETMYPTSFIDPIQKSQLIAQIKLHLTPDAVDMDEHIDYFNFQDQMDCDFIASLQPLLQKYQLSFYRELPRKDVGKLYLFAIPGMIKVSGKFEQYPPQSTKPKVIWGFTWYN